MSQTSPEIYVSTGAFKSRDIDAILDTCISENIVNLELSSGVQSTEGLIPKVKEFFEKPMRYLVHNYFPPPQKAFVLNLGSLDPETLTRSKEHCRRAMDLAVEFGAPFYSVHAGAAMNARPEDLGRPLTHRAVGSVEAAYEAFVESVRELAEYAGARGIKFLIENHVVAPFNLINGENRILFASTGEDILRLASDVDSPHLQILLDVGHLKVTAKSLRLDAYRAIEKVSNLIAAFHLSDNDGDSDQNLPFSSDAWFMPILKNFPKATYIIEAYNLDVKTIRACEDALAKL